MECNRHATAISGCVTILGPEIYPMFTGLQTPPQTLRTMEVPSWQTSLLHNDNIHIAVRNEPPPPGQTTLFCL